MPTDLSISNTIGKKDNAKTFLASIVSGLCFLLSMFTMAIIALFATNLGSSAYGHANEFNLTITGANSYIIYIVGFIGSLSLVSYIKNCDFKNKKEYIPLLVTSVVGLFTMNIALGMGMGCLVYLFMMLLDKNENKKDNLPTLIGSSLFRIIGILLFVIIIM